mmetsp:Transcript_9333/g.20356  ORF Transcript_9333/g.20356 Transcript_9333/m.20356 type:complete len:211 (+) Transcript_9333:1155-1787(+)
MLKFAFCFIIMLTNERAGLSTILGTFMTMCGDLANSSTSKCKLAKGLSNTMPPIVWSRSACRSAVTAPIDLPHRPIAPTSFSRRYSITVARSSRSCQPSDTYSPSDIPHPAKSKQNKVISNGKSSVTYCKASTRQDALPCRYTTQGAGPAVVRVFGSKCEHLSVRPRPLGKSMSVLRTFTVPSRNSLGPRSLTVYFRLGGLIIKFHRAKA